MRLICAGKLVYLLIFLNRGLPARNLVACSLTLTLVKEEFDKCSRTSLQLMS